LAENPNLFLYLCINQWNFDSTNVENPKEKNLIHWFFSSVFEPLQRLEFSWLIAKILPHISGLQLKKYRFFSVHAFNKLYRLNYPNMLINSDLNSIQLLSFPFIPVIHKGFCSLPSALRIIQSSFFFL